MRHKFSLQAWPQQPCATPAQRGHALPSRGGIYPAFRLGSIFTAARRWLLAGACDRLAKRTPRATETFSFKPKGSRHELASLLSRREVPQKLPLSLLRVGRLSQHTREVLLEALGALALGTVIAAAAWWGFMNDPAFDPHPRPALLAPSNMGVEYAPENLP